MDPDIVKVLRLAGVDPTKATPYQIALADRMIQIHMEAHSGKLDHQSAGDALYRHLNWKQP